MSRKHKVVRIFVCIVCLAFLALLFSYILPNITAITNRIENNAMAELQPDEINVVYVQTDDDGRSTYGIYLLCGEIPVHEVTLFTDAKLFAGRTKVYYITSESEEYSEDKSFETDLHQGDGGWQCLINRTVYGLRIDLNEYRNEEISINGARLNNTVLRVMPFNILPFVFMALAALAIYKKRYVIVDIFNQRKLIVSLALNDLKSRYAGSILGIVWAFIQPLLTILVLWYVFQIGFRNPPVLHVEFIVWFVAGYIPWMFINDGIVYTTNSIVDYSYLVKKIKFKVSILPAIRLLSTFIIHLFFVLVVIVVMLVFRHYPKVIWIEALYYSFCAVALIFALGMISSPLTVIFKDFGQVVFVLLQILIWYTPIFWAYENLNDSMVTVFKVNPAFYIVNGYRDTFINHVWFWENQTLNALFWGIVLLLFVLGIKLFDRCKPHFSDLL